MGERNFPYPIPAIPGRIAQNGEAAQFSDLEQPLRCYVISQS